MKKNLLLIDVLLLFLLMGYVVLGTEEAPFHGDESTIIWMSHDYDLFFIQRDVDALKYQPPPQRTTEQHLRLLNGTVMRWITGAAWHMTGFEKSEINDQWVWGLDMTWNRENGHMPSPRLLKVTRLPSAWFTALSIVPVMAIAKLLAKHHVKTHIGIHAAGWLAAAIYTLNPAVLLNGRRIMFEGGMLLGITLLAWIILIMIERPRRWYFYVLVGIVAGVAISTKHTSAFTVALLFPALFFIRRTPLIIYTLLLTPLTFLALNPLWWSQPFKMPQIVLEERQALLDLQVDLFGGYEHVSERVEGLVKETLNPEPQYYEVADWITYAGVPEEIEAYDTGNLAGSRHLFVLRLWWFILACLMFYRYRDRTGVVFLWWFFGMVIITLFTVPMHWQRYYLPLQPPLAIFMAVGAVFFIKNIRHRYKEEIHHA